MCGITGFVDFKNQTEESVLSAMINCVKHRGPDDSGEKIIETVSCKIGLGFRRLAILDLSPAGHQPMFNPDNGDWIIFNGEIYNFEEIKKELKEFNYSFSSTGDTEVILKAFQQWGVKCVDRFIGMFAIVIYSASLNKLVCFRDRAGVKPFFYYWHNGLFLFGSELKSFHKHPAFKKKIDFTSVGYYFQHGYISPPNTIFNHTYQIPAGYFLELDLANQHLYSTEYWNIYNYYNQPILNISYQEAVGETERLMISSFKYRMISDVPVGVFLSGGYDSSCVAAILQKHSTEKIKTFTIGFSENEFNEAPYAKKVAAHIGTDHNEYYCSFTDAMNIIPKLPDIYDQPFGDSSAVPTTLISSIARQHVTVALSADGGDELFAGYPRHKKSLRYLSALKNIPFKKALSKLVFSSSSSLINPDRINKLKNLLATDISGEQFNIINQTFSKSEIKMLLSKEAVNRIDPFTDSGILSTDVDLLNIILAVDYKTYLSDDIMQKVDRASMSVSLEAREPFLDHRLAEYLAVIPVEYKMAGNEQKKILKDIVHRYIPQQIMQRPKMGFGIPVKKWLNNELSELFMAYMSDDAIKSSEEYLNCKNVMTLRNGYQSGRVENFERIWFIFVFQMWLKRWM